MKKVFLIIAAVIATIIFLGSIGPLIGLAISFGIFYLALKQFMKSNETASKVLWGIIGVIALMSGIANIPALIGIIALVGLYYIYKDFKKEEASTKDVLTDDPFTNFERQWEELYKKL